MSESNGAAGHWNSKWQSAWNALLGTEIDKQLAVKLGVSSQTVTLHRRRLGIAPKGRTYDDRMWQPEWDALIGTMSDADLSIKVGCNKLTAMAHRYKLGLPRWRPDVSLIRALSDQEVMPEHVVEVAARLGVAEHKIHFERRRRGLLKRGGRLQRNLLTRAAIGGMIAALGTEVTLEQMAKVLHMTRERVRQLRNDVDAAWAEAREASRSTATDAPKAPSEEP